MKMRKIINIHESWRAESIELTKTMGTLDPYLLRHTLPKEPGIYLFKDSSGQILYVGKAKDIRKRVLSYFKNLIDLPVKTGIMLRQARSLDYIITATENEAFILESNFIKKNLPRYNVILRDDKQYPLLRLGINDRYPTLTIVRKIKKDGALYFGPFSSAGSVRSTVKIIDRIFRIRKCRSQTLPKRSRPCLNFQLDRCLGPCANDLEPGKYNEMADQVKLFLEGRNRELLSQLNKEMKQASEALDYERAAKIRDQIFAVEKTIERQIVVSPGMYDRDIIGLARRGEVFQLVILFVRKGYLQGSGNYLIRDKGDSPSEIMEAFLKQYYARGIFIPRQILISEPVEDIPFIRSWLSDLAGVGISIQCPARGEKMNLVRMALSNAERLLDGEMQNRSLSLMEDVKKFLRLNKIPRIIECFDISNFQGDMPVGSIVSFLDGLPQKSGYRNYRIRDFNNIDDYGMMSQLVKRRLGHPDLPDLFLIDGGKGHLNAVLKAMADFKCGEIPEVVAIAKADPREKGQVEKLFLPNRKNALILNKDNPVLFLLMRIRDEAHRRAVSYHRKLRTRNLVESSLDLVPGVGKKRKEMLLLHYGDISGVATAKPEELARLAGIGIDLAKKIIAHLTENR